MTAQKKYHQGKRNEKAYIYSAHHERNISTSIPYREKKEHTLTLTQS